MTDPFNNTPDSTPTSDLPGAVVAAGPDAEAAAAAPASATGDPAADSPPQAPEAPKGPSFAELGLHADVLRAIEEMGFAEPMPVQAATFPLITAGRDLMVQSRTGSGKTAAFGIPFANGIVNGEDKFVQAIVLLPTRELALQVAAELARVCQYRQMTVVPVYGGAPMGRQVEQLRAGGQIVCGTPGRVLDHLRRGTLKLDRVRCAVLDECDEMLSMGFQEDIEAILDRTPESLRNSGLRMKRREMRWIPSGTVAENSSVCRSVGVCSRIFSMSSWKPMESISSHSSSTPMRTRSSLSVPRRRWSSTRPGVPHTICPPARSCSTCRPMGAPP